MKRLNLLLASALTGFIFLFGITTQSNSAVDWQELQLQYVYGTQYENLGESINPEDGYATDDTTSMSTFTLEYNNGWKYGETYILVDMYYEQNSDEVTFYTQGFEYFGLNPIFDTEIFSLGPIMDIRPTLGWQFQNYKDYYAGDYAQYLLDTAAWEGMKPVNEAYDTIDIFYGINIPLDVTGFDFLGLSLGIYDDLNSNTDFDMQFFANLYYRSTFDIGPTSWKFEGFVSYYGDRDSSVNSMSDQQANIFSKNQFMLDIGKLIWKKSNELFIGTEIQWTMNTYGVKDIHDGYGYITKEQDEFFPTFLVEWVF